MIPTLGSILAGRVPLIALRPLGRLGAFAALSLPLGCGLGSAVSADEAGRLAEVLCLKDGVTVADLGAGKGEWAEELARHVGETGHVYATEVAERKVEKIRKRMAKAGIDNVTVVLGDQEETGLPAGCCDAVLVRLVYHHFRDPVRMRAGLKAALRPDGLAVIIDLPPQDRWSKVAGVPERGGHGIATEDLIEEMTGDGFEVVSRTESWASEDEKDLYCVVFRKLSEEVAP